MAAVFETITVIETVTVNETITVNETQALSEMVRCPETPNTFRGSVTPLRWKRQ